MRADLHMHSTYSDGTFTPKELVELAKKKGLDVIALTDHDTFEGVKEIKKYCDEAGIRLIYGAEMSTKCGKQAVHVLTYFKDEIPDEIMEFCADMKDHRRVRALKMARTLEDEYGLIMHVEELEAFKGNLTRGNLFHQMCKYNQLDEEAAFKKYLSPESKAYLPSTEFQTKDLVSLFRKYNCLIVIAHPTLYKEEVAEEVIRYDVDGIEAIYPRSVYKNQDYFADFAKQNNLLITGGSDFHGKIDFSHKDMASVTLENELLAAFLERIDTL